MNWERDPHFQLGYEDGLHHRPRETGWSDPEFQRRYDLGYVMARGCCVEPTMTFEELDRLMTERGYNR